MIPVTEENAAEAARRVKAGELPGQAKNLAEAMARVMERVSYVQKDKQMTGGGSYRYASVENVIAALRPEMVKEQLILIPMALEPLTMEVFESKSGSRQNRTQVKYTFELLHGPSGQAKPVVVIGEGMDVGDKSSNKAMTAARKYALVMAFNIETGTDPDDTSSHEQQRQAPRQQPQHEPTKQATASDKDLVNRFEHRLRECSSRQQYEQITSEIVECVRAKTLSAQGQEYLREPAKAASARFPKQQPATAGRR